MSRFDEELCSIPEIWCGDSENPDKKKYYKTGSRTECLKKGFGAGMHNERKKGLVKSSLQNIKYVGEVHEKNFSKVGIKTIANLITQMGSKTKLQIEKTLKKILVKKDGDIDFRAYNSVLLYLYTHGVANVPSCKKISAK